MATLDHASVAPRRHSILPIGILIAGLLCTTAVTLLLAHAIDLRGERRFSGEVQKAIEKIHARIASHLALLRGGTALFSVDGDVTPQEWKNYIDRLRVDDWYPGVQGIGFSMRVPAAEVRNVIEWMQQSGVPNFRIWPEGVRDEYHTIVYLEPMDLPNRVAIGFDMFTEPVRRAAMETAWLSGGPATSGKVRLVQEILPVEQAGFLIYLPVYRHPDSLPDAAERRDSLIGFVYSPFRADDLFRGVFGAAESLPFVFEVFDGAEPVAENLLHRSQADAAETSRLARFHSTTTIQLPGRTWTLRFASLPGFGGNTAPALVPLVAVIGVSASLLLFYFTHREAQAREATERSALHLARERERLHVTLESIGDAVVATDLAGRIEFINHAAQELIGWQTDEVRGRMFGEVMPLIHERTWQPADPVQRVLQGAQALASGQPAILVTRDERHLAVTESAAPIRDEHGALAGVILVFHEITEERRYQLRNAVQHAVTRVLAEAQGLKDAGPRLLDAIGLNLNLDAGVLWQVDDDTASAQCLETWVANRERLADFHAALRQQTLLRGRGLSGLVWATGRPTWITDITKDEQSPLAAEAAQAGLRTAFAFPIRLGPKLAGSLEFFTRTSQPIDSDLLNLMEAIGSQIGQFIERKNAERQLRASEELHRAVTEAAADAIVTLDEDDIIVSVNPVAEHIFGYTAAEMIGRPFTVLLPAHLHIGHLERLGSFLATGERPAVWNQLPLQMRRKDGSLLQAEASVGVSKRNERTVFTTLIRDVTARRQTEEALRRTREQFQLLFDFNVIGFCIAAPDGRITEANSAFLEMLGYTREDLETGLLHIAAICPPEWHELDEQLVAEFARSGRFGPVQKEYLHKNGSRVPVLIGAARHEETALGITFALDLTQQKKIERALERARKQLQRANVELEQRVEERTARLRETVADLETFSYSISHDMRSPLRCMQGYAQVLADDYGPRLDAAARRYLESIASAAQRLDRLIQDVLAYSKIARAELPMEPVDLTALIGEIVAQNPSMQTPHAEIRIEPDLPGVWGNRAALFQCLANLLINAVKFVAPGVQPRVLVRLERLNENARVIVEDNGIGIPPDAQGKIFRMFQRLDPTYDGTGVGLAIVKRSAERMGGTVGVESMAGGGSRFWIELKLAQLEPATQPT